MTQNSNHLRQKAAGAKNWNSTRRLRVAVDSNLNPYDLELEDFDVANPEIHRLNLAESYLRRLREEAPVHYCKKSQYGPYWSITKYSDIMQVDKDHQAFSSSYEFGGVSITGTPNSGSEIPNFISMDPPKHDQQRKAVAPGLSPVRLADLEILIRGRVIEILDSLPRYEEFDWVERVAVELTGRMLATILGVPQEDRQLLIGWSNAISNADDPDYVSASGGFYETLAELGEYIEPIWETKKNGASSDMDLLALLANSPEGSNMPIKEVLGNVVLLLVGGNDTTRNSISGGLLALNQFPSEYDKLIRNPELIASMVPEIIRWQTPLAHMRRTATRDYGLRGQTIKKGDMVIMWYLSGNRDPEAIANPDQFIIDRRRPREHLSFGFGLHRCLGNRLAEMQLRVLWEEMVNRCPRIKVTGEVVRASSPLFRAIQTMPVTMDIA